MWSGGEKLDASQQFEKGRIRSLQEERIRVQQKTFTKWINFHLKPTGIQVNDLFQDIRNGRMLHQLLQVISGEMLPKVSRGVMRIQQLENVGISLTFLSKKVVLENIGASDIVDGNKRLILGLIWTIILRFQIQQIVFEQQIEPEQESTVKKSAKESLLLWCQRQVEPYPNVQVTNFDKSWQDGLAFNALLHSRRPDLVNFNSLSPGDAEGNLRGAFDSMEHELCIPRLLDPEDVVHRPDDKSIMTYVAQIYSAFAKMKAEERSGRRMENVVRMLKNIHDMEKNYVALFSDLVTWVRIKTKELNNRTFPNSLSGIQQHLDRFNGYRTEEKPAKYKEKGELHMMFHSINVKCFANNRIPFYPPEGHLIKNLEAEWEVLDKAERDLLRAIVAEYLRLEALERVAERFKRKEKLRMAWLEDMWEIVDDQEQCRGELPILAAFQRNEAILLDVQAREEKFAKAKELARFLWNNNYHNKEDVNKREKRLRNEYDKLRAAVHSAHVVLKGANDAGVVARQTVLIRQDMKALEPSLLSKEYGSHLMMVEDLLRRHSLLEGQIVSLDARISQLQTKVNNVVAAQHVDSEKTKKSYNDLKKDFKLVKDFAVGRRKALEQNLDLFQFHQDADEEEMWLDEQMRIMQNPVVAKDLLSVLDLQKKQKAFEQKIGTHDSFIKDILDRGQVLKKNPKNFGVEQRMEILPEKLQTLKNLSSERLERLQDALETQQYYTDANDIESWMKEKLPLVSSDNYGQDAITATNLFEAHKKLNEEIDNFEVDISKLREDADRLKKTELALQPMSGGVEAGVMDEFIEEEVYLPVEVEDREMIAREIDHTDTEVREIPRVVTLREFKDPKSGVTVKAGQYFDLQDDSDELFWVVKDAQSRREFTLPKNLLKGSGTRHEERHISKVHTVHEEVSVRRIQKRKQKVRRRKTIKTGIAPLEGSNITHNSRFDAENIQLRQQTIESTFKQLRSLSSARHQMLKDYVELFTFFVEAEELLMWTESKDKWIRSELRQKRDAPDALRHVLETFLTELVAYEPRVARILKEGENLSRGSIGTSNKRKITTLMASIQSKWEALKKLKKEKESILAGAAGLNAFEAEAEGALEASRGSIAFLEAGIASSNNSDSSSGLLKHKLTPEDIQGEINKLNKTVRPLDERLNRLVNLGKSLAATNPAQAAVIKKKVAEIQKAKDDLQKLLAERLQQLEREKKLCQFKKDCESEINWAGKALDAMSYKDQPTDLATVSEAIDQHKRLKDEIDLRAPVIEDLIQQAVLLKPMSANDKEFPVLESQIKSLPSRLRDEWKDHDKFLDDCRQAAQFYREADGVEAQLGAQLALLSSNNIGASVDEVEALQRQLDEQKSKIQLLDDKTKSLENKAAKMSRDRNVAAGKVNAKLGDVKKLRDKTLHALKKREKNLKDSLDYQRLLRDVSEMDDWMKEKLAVANDPDLKEMTNLVKKEKMISNLKSEIDARYDDLNTIAERGKQLMAQQHYASPEIREALLSLAKRWKELKSAVEGADSTIDLSQKQKILRDKLRNKKERLAELEDMILVEENGRDLEDANDLLRGNDEVEEEIIKATNDVNGQLAREVDDLIQKGHHDPESVRAMLADYANKVASVSSQANGRKLRLKDSVKFFQWKEDALSQKEWFLERMDDAESTLYGFNLDSTANLLTRNQTLDRELSDRETSVKDLLMRAQEMIVTNHWAKEQIEALGDEITQLWNSVNAACAFRMAALESQLQFHRLFMSLEDALEWVEERLTQCQSRKEKISCHPDKLDERKIGNALSNHKTEETAVSRYCTSLNDLDAKCSEFVESRSPMAESILAKQTELGDNIEYLTEELERANKYFEACKMAVEFQIESTDLCDWFIEAATKAQSPDYGKDFESFQKVKTEFVKLQDAVQMRKSNQLNNCQMLNSRISKTWSGDGFQWVEEKLEELLSMMSDLEMLMSEREELMESAGELHKFNLDVVEALSLIQEKETELPDVNASAATLQGVQKLLRKHEGFETELVVLEAQLHALVEEADRLVQVYPGENEESLEESKRLLINAWQGLKRASAKRKHNLLLSLEFHKYKSASKDLLDWLAEQKRIVSALKEPPNNADSVKQLSTELDDVKKSLANKEDDFKTLVERSDRMITSEELYPKDEVDQLLSSVLDNKASLEEDIESLIGFLDSEAQFFGFHSKYRNLKQLLANEVQVLNSRNSGKVSQHDPRGSIREQEALENKVNKEQVLVDDIQKVAHELQMARHPRSKEVADSTNELLKTREQVLAKCKARRALLDATVSFVDFKTKAAEEESWLKEKKILADNEDYKKADTFEQKIKVLQKHQALESEIDSGKMRFDLLKADAEKVIYPGPYGTDCKTTVRKLQDLWQKLTDSLNRKNSVLSEAREVVRFFNECDASDHWLKEKETLLKMGDFGNDYEQCLAILNKLNKVSPDELTPQKLANLNKLADTLATKGQLDPAAVKSRKEEINGRYANVASGIKDYSAALQKALEVHKFIRDCNELTDLIGERTAVARSDDVGDSLDYAQKLLNRHELVQKTTIPELQKKMGTLKEQGSIISQRLPERQAEVEDALERVNSSWSVLRDVTAQRQKSLQNSVDCYTFLHNCALRNKWVFETIDSMQNRVSPKSVKEANNFFKSHESVKKEIENTRKIEEKLIQNGVQLKQKTPENAGKIEDAIVELKGNLSKVGAVWGEVAKEMQDDISYQQFLKEAANCEISLSNCELFFDTSNIGDSLSSVEALLTKYNTRASVFVDMTSETNSCIEQGNNLISNGNYLSAKIKQRIDELLAKLESSVRSCDCRKEKLAVSKDVQLFLQKARKTLMWIADQDKKALEESYKDPTNLLHKIEMHSNFESSVKLHEEEVVGLRLNGEKLLETKFSTPDSLLAGEESVKLELESKVSELSEEWQMLLDHCAEKKLKLREALQVVDFNRSAESVEIFADECEKEFESHDNGDSLKSVKALTAKHEKTKEKLRQKSEVVASLLDTIDSLRGSDGVAVNAMQQRMDKIVDMYDGLERAAKVRDDELSSSHVVFTFIDKVNAQSKWVDQKLMEAQFNYDWTQSSSTSIVDSMLISSGNLDDEIVLKEETVKSLESEGNALAQQHPNHKDSVKKCVELFKLKFHNLKATSEAKTEVLQIIQKALKLLTRTNEARSWLSEKERFLLDIERQHYVVDEQSCQNMLDQVTHIDSELDNQRKNLKQTDEDIGVMETCEKLPNREVLRVRLNDLYAYFETVKTLCCKRREVLAIRLRQFLYLEEVAQMLVDLDRAKDVCHVDDYGHDVESVEILISGFRSEQKEWQDLEARCDELVQTGTLLASEPGTLVGLSEKTDQLSASCQELRTLRDARAAALEGARLVHKLNRDMADCRTDIQDKQTELSSEHDIDDFESLQLMYDQQDSLNKEIKDLKSRVDKLNDEGDLLIERYGNAESIKAKMADLSADWNRLVAMSRIQQDNLKRLGTVKEFYDMFGEIMQWINETITTMNSDDLPRDVPGSSLKVKHHDILKQSIRAKDKEVKALWQKGQTLIESGVSVQEDIHEKRCRIQDGYKVVENTWAQRSDLYKINLDLQEFLADVENVESWIQQKMPQVASKDCGNNLIEVEDLLKKQHELEELIDAQQEKIAAVQRRTKLESGLAEWKEREEERVRDEQRRKVQASLRKRETTRITDERQKRNREQRRRTQEISFPLPLQPSSSNVSDGEPARPNSSQLSGPPSASQKASSFSAPEKKLISPFLVDYAEEQTSENGRGLNQQTNKLEESSSPVHAPIVKRPMIRKESFLNRRMDAGNSASGTDVNGSVSPSRREDSEPTSPLRKAVSPGSSFRVEDRSVQARLEKDHQDMRNAFSSHRHKNIESAALSAAEETAAATTPTLSSPTHPNEEPNSGGDHFERTPSVKSANSYASINSSWSTARFSDSNTTLFAGMIEKKAVMTNGRKATNRNWKPYYAVVMSGAVKFFKDEHAFLSKETCSALAPLERAICEDATDYKKKHTLRLMTKEGSEFLLDCKNEETAASLMKALNEEADRSSSSSAAAKSNQPVQQQQPSRTASQRPNVPPPRPPASLGPILEPSSAHDNQSSPTPSHKSITNPPLSDYSDTHNFTHISRTPMTNGSFHSSNPVSFKSKVANTPPPLPPKPFRAGYPGYGSGEDSFSKVTVTSYNTRHTPAIIAASNKLASITYGSPVQDSEASCRAQGIEKSTSMGAIANFSHCQEQRPQKGGARMSPLIPRPPRMLGSDLDFPEAVCSDYSASTDSNDCYPFYEVPQPHTNPIENSVGMVSSRSSVTSVTTMRYLSSSDLPTSTIAQSGGSVYSSRPFANSSLYPSASSSLLHSDHRSNEASESPRVPRRLDSVSRRPEMPPKGKQQKPSFETQV